MRSLVSRGTLTVAGKIREDAGALDTGDGGGWSDVCIGEGNLRQRAGDDVDGRTVPTGARTALGGTSGPDASRSPLASLGLTTKHS